MLNLSLRPQGGDLAQWEMVKMEQSLQVMSKQERLENWTARIIACRSSGMTVRAWCQENGLSEKTYYYWQRRLFQVLSEQQQFDLDPFTNTCFAAGAGIASRRCTGKAMALYCCTRGWSPAASNGPGKKVKPEP